jgi:hypothetical protein
MSTCTYEALRATADQDETARLAVDILGYARPMRTWIVVVLLSMGCSHVSNDAAKAPSIGMKDPAALLAGVPDDAVAVGLIDAGRPLIELLGSFLDPEDGRAFEKELLGFIEGRTGLSLGNVSSATVYVGRGDGAVIVHGVAGTLKGRGGKQVEGVTLFRLELPDEPEAKGLWVGERGGDLVIGTLKGVLAVMAAAARKPSALSARPELVQTLVSHAAGASLAVGFDARILPVIDPSFAVVGQFGVKAGFLSFREGTLRGTLVGDPAGLEKLDRLAQEALDKAAAELDKQKQVATRNGSLLEGAGAIALWNFERSMARAVRPKRSGGTLMVEVPMSLDRAAMAIPVAGILAAVAIPAFMKNARKARTSEATTNVKKLYDGARAYFEEEGGRGGKSAGAKHFPVGHVGPTPPLGACCHEGSAAKCTPDPKLWQHPIWQALRFSMDDPHYYSYAYVSDGKSFSVDAYGDLNCNGVYSTFEMIGEVAPDGTVAGGNGIYKDHELE